MKKIKNVKIKDKFAEERGLDVYICPYCKQRYYSPDKLIDYAKYCPNCGEKIQVIKNIKRNPGEECFYCNHSYVSVSGNGELRCHKHKDKEVDVNFWCGDYNE